MTTYTKYTLSTTVDPLELPTDVQPLLNAKLAQFIPLMDAKLAEMKAEGKTDGVRTVISSTQAKRVWLDQAAAEEFIAFSEASKNSFNLVNSRIEIFDNV